MNFRFWGVRGSIPSPLTPAAVKAKVAAVLQRVRTADLESSENRERFLATLPPEIFGHVGGNTACLELSAGEDVLIVDAGTGIRELGHHYKKKGTRPRHFHVFLTHFHWDHLQGLPFFDALYQAQNRITFYSTVSGFADLVRSQMREPFFPVPWSKLPAQIAFVELGSPPLSIAGTRILWKSVNHPGSCTSYRFERHGRSLIFSTDTELRIQDFERSAENLAFYENADVLIFDAQYTLREAFERTHWGHSSAGYAVDFALAFGIKKLYLFHHEPSHDDATVEELGRTSQWYADHQIPGRLKVVVAREGGEEDVG